MSKTNNGGPAFPLFTPEWHEEVSAKGLSSHDFTMGMTLRDYFAAKAMQGFASMMTSNAPELYYILAKDAYKLADVMLKARET